MKTKILLMSLMLVGFAVFTSCDDDDDNDNRIQIPPEAVVKAFAEKYPNATYVVWEYKHGFYVAEFLDVLTEVDAWFSPDTEWKMTETDVRGVDNLPAEVKQAFLGSAYSTWIVEDIDKYERPVDTFYLIEVGKHGAKDRNLYYAPDGTLIKDVEDTPNDDVLPNTKL